MPTNRFDSFFGFTSFGESHGPAIGLVIDSPPPGLDFPHAELKAALARRQLESPYRTARRESDEYEILSGIFEGKTTGMPLCIIVRNRDAKSQDYEALKDVFRPGHADFAWYQKYHIYDYRGGGRASGRETLCRIIAASLSENILGAIEIDTQCLRIGQMTAEPSVTSPDNPFNWPDPYTLSELEQYLDKAKAAGNSLGGIIRLRASKVPPGLGDPVYEKLSANIAKAMLSIPSVKGISFGDGEDLAAMSGFEANDQMGESGFISNHLGGLSGGVTNGNDLIFSLIIRPVASVSTPQSTIDKAGNPCSISISGRHDVCHIPRIIPVCEAMLKLCLADAIQHQRIVLAQQQDIVFFRESLDKLDEELLLLLNRRKKIVEGVKAFKLSNNMPAKDNAREQEILERTRRIGSDLGLDPDLISQIMKYVLKSSQ